MNLVFKSGDVKEITYADLLAMFDGEDESDYKVGDLEFDGNDLTCVIYSGGVKASIVTFNDPYEHENVSLEDYDLDKVTVDYIEEI